MAKFRPYPPKAETRAEPAPVVAMPDDIIALFPPDPRDTSVTLDGETFIVADGKLTVPKRIADVLRKVGYTLKPRK